ncbi:MAG: hypothetical protein HXY30_20640 [Pseudorhodoplanes sp.]|nr:hypothetical protein [Pseudorhodoplanes sp.]
MPYDPTRDAFASVNASFSAQARLAELVTPSDAADLVRYAKALRIYVPASVAGGVGAVRVTPLNAADGDSVTLKVPPGVTIEPLAVRRVWSTGTSAGIEVHAYTV